MPELPEVETIRRHLAPHVEGRTIERIVAEPPYVRVRVTLDSGERALFTDPRRFGTGLVLLGDAARDDYFSERLGVEPLSPDFTAAALKAMARNRKQPV